MKSKSAMDEVEELLKAAEDEMVLKLKVDSHISRSSPSYLEPDLEHRFQALKKPSSSSSSSSSSKTNKPVSNSQLPQPSPQRTITDAKSVQSFQDDDDLYARFAALKGISSSSSSSSSSIPPARSDSGGVQIDPSNGKKNNDDDEVEKIIQWAIDAARLDPSPPTDDDDDEDEDDDYDEEDDDDDEELDDRVKGGCERTFNQFASHGLKNFNPTRDLFWFSLK